MPTFTLVTELQTTKRTSPIHQTHISHYILENGPVFQTSLLHLLVALDIKYILHHFLSLLVTYHALYPKYAVTQKIYFSLKLKLYVLI